MKKLFAAIALSAALAFPVAVFARGGGDAGSNNAVDDIVLEGEFTNDGRPEISGTLFNTSDNTAYDDVVIRVDYYDQAHNIIASKDYTVKSDVEEGEDESFDIKLDAPKDMFTADFNVVRADLD